MATELLQKDFNSIKSDLGNLKKDFGQLINAAVDSSKDAANSTMKSVKAQSAKAAETVKSTVEKHPIASVAVALGAGFVIGKIMNHNHK
jgi:ElaB/YqjD/DUF883 family membrane-anchored ribosome-binding protein